MNFFIRNFPESCYAEKLRSRFEEIGPVVEVLIPGKKDMRGKKFGFVRFSGKGKEAQILKQLNNVWIGIYIIRAFTPKFERPKPTAKGKFDRFGARGYARVRPFLDLNKSRRMVDASFAEILSGKGRQSEGEKEVIERRKETISFQSEEEERSWLRDAVTGFLKDEVSWSEHG